MQGALRQEQNSELSRWIKRFLLSQPYLSPLTRKTYQCTLIRFVHAVDRVSGERDSDPIVVTQKAVVHWLRYLSARMSFRTLSLQVIPVRRFCAFLENKRVLRDNPFRILLTQYPRRGLRGIVRALTGDCPRKAMEALTPVPRFNSPLGPSLRNFLAFERSLGKRYEGEAYTLREFDEFLNSDPQPPTRLTSATVNLWLCQQHTLQPTTQYKHFLLIRKFCIYLRRSDPGAYVPPSWNGPRRVKFIPQLYSRTDIAHLLGAARQLTATPYCPLLPEMFYLLIALLYTAGLRLSEALKLQLGDIGWDERMITIRETKFFKSRVVPLSPSMGAALNRYVRLAQRSGIPCDRVGPLFRNPRTCRAFTKTWAERMFRVVCERAQLKRSGRFPSRVHDLRHSFAVHRIEDWYEAGDDVPSKLGLLSTYMGHVGIAGTQQYLTMTSELLQHASERFEKFYQSNIKEISQ